MTRVSFAAGELHYERVIARPSVRADGTIAHGAYDPQTRTIVVPPPTNTRDQATWMHEQIHMICDQMGLGLGKLLQFAVLHSDFNILSQAIIASLHQDAAFRRAILSRP